VRRQSRRWDGVPANYFAGLPSDETKLFVEAFRNSEAAKTLIPSPMVAAQAIKDAGSGADKAKIEKRLDV
jgi:hypothetical protein